MNQLIFALFAFTIKGRILAGARGGVCALIARGFVLKELALEFGCHRDTIYARFSNEIKKGRRLAHRIQMKEWARHLNESPEQNFQ